MTIIVTRTNKFFASIKGEIVVLNYIYEVWFIKFCILPLEKDKHAT